MNATTLTKGMRVTARWMEANNPPSSLSGMQMKIGVHGREVTGIVTHIRGDHPTKSTKFSVAIKPDDGPEVWVDPKHIIEVHAQRSTITNTRAQAENDPRQIVAGALKRRHKEALLEVLPLESLSDVPVSRRKPDGFTKLVLEQEAQGQAEVVNSGMLPIDGSGDPAWAKLGVTFGSAKNDDPLFREAQMPPGWKVVPHESSSMWSDLVDEKGRARAAIFYKAAFYDRSARISLNRRFSPSSENSKEEGGGLQGTVVDRGQVGGKDVQVYASPFFKKGPNVSIYDLADKAAYGWLKENYPDWEDPTKYWDLP